jgi:hypothetical protein
MSDSCTFIAQGHPDLRGSDLTINRVNNSPFIHRFSVKLLELHSRGNNVKLGHCNF